ncbi:OX-2 membrane glycoprotein-like isoform X2 [Gambusia affinis]|uniref:OX-2 membrane glycoprotein-like isoform X2 n=1 Tax=Gambusia affinis TaxID=33528 RepID=UPI001CDC91C4|nr:OX-2 membrane glycoprotein-like isoform X2 [Gambusia affinis]
MMESTRFVFFLLAGLLHKGEFMRRFLTVQCDDRFTGFTAVVQTQHTRIAEVGKDAQLSCQFVAINSVQEVTWQKVLGSTKRDVSTYNLLSGEKVFSPFKDKVQFAYSKLKNNSIIIKNVTEHDVGCYLCLFNAYPMGNVTAETCLRFNELHGPFIVVRRSKIPPGSLVACSATGQPAPTVTLSVEMVCLYSTSSKTNANGTITVTTTALLPAVSSTLVRCSVEVDFTDPRKCLITVPGVGPISGEQSQVGKWMATFTLLMLLLCICFCGLRRKCQNRKVTAKDVGTVTA